jgi:hypothetical protein
MKGRIAIVVSIMFVLACIAQAQQPTVTLELIPSGILDHRQAQLFVTVESPQELNGAVLEVHASSDFQVSPSTIALPSVTRSVIENVEVTLINPKLLAGDQAVTVTLSQPSQPNDPKTSKILVSKLVKFSYTPEIPVSVFFLFAMIGLVLGYWVRLVVKVLGGVEPPSPAPEQGGPQIGPITKFVKAHYYTVDFLVTVILAFIVLATLVQGGRPPQAGATWYGALASGVGIGLFTNSELLTRLRK